MSHQFTAEGWPNNIGKRGRLVHPDKHITFFTIIDEIRKPQSNYPPKVIYLQLIQFDDERRELRLCYYIKGKIGRTKGKWVFGQFATLLPSLDFKEIITEAKLREWL